MKISVSKRLLGAIVLTTLGSALALAATPTVAQADYPNKAVRLIVPFPPGGGSDIVGRLLASKLSEGLGKQVIVDNRGGAGGVIGTEVAAKADPDGYTMLLIAGSHTIFPALLKLPFDAVKSFTPVARLATGPSVLVVNEAVPAKDVKELITLAKAKPGQLVFASSGIAGSAHMSMELFKIMSDTDFKIVQFKGGGPAIIDLLGGHSQATIGSLTQALPHIKTGKFRVLATGGLKRSDLLPDVPTIAESGLPGFDVSQWYGIVVPAGTPPPIVARLTKEFNTVMASDDLKKRLVNEGLEPDFLPPAAFATFMQNEMATWARVTQKANIKLEQ